MKKLTVFCVCFLLTGICHAQIITVDDDAPADFNNIQEAIDDSNDGDIIEVRPGTYTGSGNRDIDPNGKAVTIRSIDPNDPNIVAATIIDCNGSEAEPHRGFYFHNQEDFNSVLKGLTISNGYGLEQDEPLWGPTPLPAGGAILCSSSNPEIRNCIIRNSFATYGGGILCNASSPTLIGCTIINNSAHSGAGMYNYENSNPTVINCTFSDNWVSLNGRGGGIVSIESNPFLSYCAFIHNQGGGAGGGMYNGGGSPILTNCEFIGNSAPVLWLTGGGGGGMYSGDGSPDLLNCIFSGNWSHVGGGMSNEAGTPSLLNCTFVGNLANCGKGIINLWEQAIPKLTNCILWDGKDGNEIFNMFGAAISITYSDVQGGWPGPGNIDADPCFVESGYWDANGTADDANDDFWVDGDYHLKSEGWRWVAPEGNWTWDNVTSRCIDAGNPGSPLADELLVIPRDPDNLYGRNLRINMGAYGGTTEASMPPHNWAILADLTNDGKVDLDDLAGQVEDWLNSSSDQPEDLDRNGIIDMVDFALLGKDWLKQTTWHEP